MNVTPVLYPSSEAVSRQVQEIVGGENVTFITDKTMLGDMAYTWPEGWPNILFNETYISKHQASWEVDLTLRGPCRVRRSEQWVHRPQAWRHPEHRAGSRRSGALPAPVFLPHSSLRWVPSSRKEFKGRDRQC